LVANARMETSEMVLELVPSEIPTDPEIKYLKVPSEIQTDVLHIVASQMAENSIKSKVTEAEKKLSTSELCRNLIDGTSTLSCTPDGNSSEESIVCIPEDTVGRLELIQSLIQEVYQSKQKIQKFKEKETENQQIIKELKNKNKLLNENGGLLKYDNATLISLHSKLMGESHTHKTQSSTKSNIDKEATFLLDYMENRLRGAREKLSLKEIELTDYKEDRNKTNVYIFKLKKETEEVKTELQTKDDMLLNKQNQIKALLKEKDSFKVSKGIKINVLEDELQKKSELMFLYKNSVQKSHRQAFNILTTKRRLFNRKRKERAIEIIKKMEERSKELFNGPPKVSYIV